MVPKASARRARLARGEFAVAQEAAFFADPDESADVVEEIDEKKTKINSPRPMLAAARRSSLRNVPEGCGSEKKFAGQCARPRGIPARVMATMPMRMALPMRRAIRMAMRIRPRAARRTWGSETLPMLTKVAGLATMIFALRIPMKAMNRPMPAAVAVLETIGDTVDDLLADVGECEDEEEETGQKDDTKSSLPGNAAAKDDGISEVSVEGHAGSEGDWIVGPQAHDERGDRGGNASGEENAFDGHAGFGEDAGVDDDHVGHGHERGEASEKFSADGGMVFFEMKNAVEQTVSLPIKRCATIGQQRPEVNAEDWTRDSDQCSTMSRTTLSPTICAASNAVGGCPDAEVLVLGEGIFFRGHAAVAEPGGDRFRCFRLAIRGWCPAAA